ncbi:MAG: hypothetical protein RL410_1394, partial [Actinomycetota bacterium]
MSDIKSAVLAAATSSKNASVGLRQLSRNVKDAAIVAIADALVAHIDDIVAANALDVAEAKSNGTSEAIVDRLTLNAQRIADIADA